MDNYNKKTTNAILPDINRVTTPGGVRAFSVLCEATCSNLFAFSPFILNIDSDDFLQFQHMADELKELIAGNDVTLGMLCNLCSRINKVYEKLMTSCWEAFVENSNLESEPGKFIVRQMIIVKDFTDAIS